MNRIKLYEQFEGAPEALQLLVDALSANFAPISFAMVTEMARSIERELKCKTNILTDAEPYLSYINIGHWPYVTVKDSLKMRIIYSLFKDGRLQGFLETAQQFERGYMFEQRFATTLRLRQELYSFLEGKKSDKIDYTTTKAGEYSPEEALFEALLFEEGYRGLNLCLSTVALEAMMNMAVSKQISNLDSGYATEKIFQLLRTSPKVSKDFEEYYRILQVPIKVLSGAVHLPEHVHTTIMLNDLYGFAITNLRKGEIDQALIYFDTAIKVEKKFTKMPFPQSDVFNFFYGITLISSPRAQMDGTIAKLAKTKSVKANPILYTLLAVQNGEIRSEVQKHVKQLLEEVQQTLFSKLMIWLSSMQSEVELTITEFDIDQLIVKCQVLGFEGLLLEIYNQLKDQERLLPLQEKLGYRPVTLQEDQEDEWERILNAIIGQGEKRLVVGSKERVYRVAYLYDTNNNNLSPIVQQSKDGVSWTRGKAVSLQRFATYQAEGITEQDKRVADCVARDSYYRRQYEINLPRALYELIGHPYVFLEENSMIPVEIAEMKPELTILHTDKGFKLEVNVENIEDSLQVIRESNTRVRVIKLNNDQLTYLKLLKQLHVLPLEAKDKLLSLLKKLTGIITVYSDLIDESENLKSVAGDSRIYVQLIPIGDTLKAELFIKPFSQNAPYCKAGVGAKSVIGFIGEEKAQATRNLELEAANCEQVKSALDRIIELEADEDTYYFEDPYHSLELMESIGSMADVAVVEWPEGAKFKIAGVASFKNLSLSLRGRGNWFDIEGELNIGDETLFSMAELLKTLRKSKGRFIELKNGEFLALTDQFRRQLLEMDAMMQESKEGLSMQNFAASIFEEMQKMGVEVEGDKSYREMRKRIGEIEERSYKVSKKLQAELRDYQLEGFCWMARLNDWGAGACLADDMGLGKTVQTIAMLLHKSKSGPSLVVAPASVLPNWVREINRFAPTLNVINLAPAGDRIERLKAAKANDICVVTYGVLVSESLPMIEKKFAMTVLDEAHTIKNKETKMSKVAMQLQSDFRLLLTGTPIQNHLGEIWNLFNFINPGLLGTFERFRERFVVPIVEFKDREQQRRLKRLISPFLLRRTKSAVLDELPPKTEVIKEIQLNEVELAAYELLRRQAEDKLAESSEVGQIQALAEITRLRMAAANINLTNPGVEMASSKIQTFLDIVDELGENSHRALVFSQFTSHLALIKKELDKRGISYLYLDGSTPLNERDRLVREFQEGEQLLFLISLKAGGLGLNLTAADFVIHMDPWWNPAIEDQASDRAYRIGQQRPVTIYRLIARNTIEEKIIRLHATKKDLADSLLEGSDISNKLSREELLELLRS